MNKKIVISKAKDFGNRSFRFLIKNFYTKPKLLLKILFKPSLTYGVSYFPELERKSKVRIFFDFVHMILMYATIDEYYYMYGLDVKREIKLKEYVMYTDFMRERDKLNLSGKHNDSCILRNKLLFEGVAKLLGIPTPSNVIYIKEGKLKLLHSENSTSINWANFSEVLSDGTYYLKPLDGECGTDIQRIIIRSGQILINDKIIPNNDFASLCKNGSFLIQRELIQHSEMSRIYPKSVNTIRMTTVRNPKTNEIEVLPPTLRIGANNSIVDNFSKGGVIVALDTESGRLSEWGFFKPKYGLKEKYHPDSKIEFSSFVIPFYQEAKERAKDFHSYLNLHSIGWDIAITENGPVFIEGNDNWEINLPQTFENPMKNEFKRLFLVK